MAWARGGINPPVKVGGCGGASYLTDILYISLHQLEAGYPSLPLMGFLDIGPFVFPTFLLPGFELEQ